MLSSSVFAQTQNKSFYLGAEAGAVMFKNIEIDNLEHKSQTSPTLGIKGGYYFNDMFRSEIAVSMPLDINYKFNGTFYGLDDGGQFYGLPVNYKIKGKGLAVFINGYIDLLNINNTAKIFIGGGIGASKINGKYKINLTLLDGSKKELVFSKSKNALSFAYQISVGASYMLTEGVNSELSYRYSDYGKIKSKNLLSRETESMNIKGHNVLAGIRFDI